MYALYNICLDNVDMFFNSYVVSNYQKKQIIDLFYQKIVNISRSKVFYTKLYVPDTLDGRYDLLALFSIILTFSMSRTGSKGIELSQILFDKIFLDLDLSLRELGAGDAGVHIKIKNMVKSYMGRQKVYCDCFEINDFKKLEKHIVNNVYRNVKNYHNSHEKLAEYCKECVIEFKDKNIKYFLSDDLNFPNLDKIN